MNKFYLVLILLYISYVYGEQCVLQENQYYDLTQYPGIKDRLVDGIINFNKKYYAFNSNLPVPSQNYVLRFQWHRTDNYDKSDLFIPKNSNDQYLQLKFRNNKLTVYLKSSNGSDYTEVSLSNLLDNQYTAFAFYVSESSLKIYYNGRLQKTLLGSFTLGQFSGTEYDIDNETNDPRGYMKELSIVQNVSEKQLSCLVGYSSIKTCPEGDAFFNGQCMDCLQFSASLYNVNMQASGAYNTQTNSTDFVFQATDLYVPQCVTGSLKDSNGNEISYEGSIDDLTFSYTQQQVDSLCPSVDGKVTCQFKYTLQIQDSIQVNFAVFAIQKQSYEVSANKTYAGKLNQTMLFADDQEDNDEFGGVVVNKQYSFETSYNEHSGLVFFSSPLFMFPLGDRPYSFGSNIFAQLQVSQEVLRQGFQIQFISATLDGQSIEPYDQAYSQEGYLNLSFKPLTHLYSKVITLNVEYALVQQNSTETPSLMSSQQQILVEDLPQKEFLSQGQEAYQSLYETILNLFN